MSQLEFSLPFETPKSILHHPSCVTLDWLCNIETLNIHPQCLSSPCYENDSLTWVDNDGRLFCLAFPAVLKIKGRPSCECVYDESVEVFFFI